MHPIETALQMAGEWGAQTLEELRTEAAAEPNKLAFASLRANGRRFCMVVCIADMAQAFGGRTVTFSDDCPVLDWSACTLAEAVLLAAPTTFVFPIRSASDSNALALIAAGPDSMASMGELFVLPP
jgi:hypothetical protein